MSLAACAFAGPTQCDPAALTVPKCAQTGNTGDKHGDPYIVGRCMIGDRAIKVWCPAPGYDNDGPCQTSEPT